MRKIVFPPEFGCTDCELYPTCKQTNRTFLAYCEDVIPTEYAKSEKAYLKKFKPKKYLPTEEKQSVLIG